MSTATDLQAGFSCEVLLEKDIPECIRLASESFQIPPAHLEQWFERRILRNPWQRSLPGLGVGIRHAGRLIASRAMMGQPWWLTGKSTVLAFCAHTAVDSRYRGRGLATSLIRESEKFAAVVGSTTAGNITQKAYEKLGYHRVGGDGNDFFRTRTSFRGSLEKRAGRTLGAGLSRILDLGLRARDFRLGAVAGLKLHETFRCDHEFDVLWERARPGYEACLERSSAYLNWRLFDYPTCPLRLAALRNSSGRLRAYGVWHEHAFDPAVNMAVLRDLFYPVEDEAAGRALLRRLLEHWRNSGISWASLEVASPLITALFGALGYERVPSQGNRYQIRSRVPLPEKTLNNWFRSGIDGDYFDLPVSSAGAGKPQAEGVLIPNAGSGLG